MTPSERDLTITANPADPVTEGRSVTFTCTAPRVKPPPKEMYLMFTDGGKKIYGQNKTRKNFDGLTSNISLEYTVTVYKSMNGGKIMCNYVTQDGKTVSSLMEVTVKVLCKFYCFFKNINLIIHSKISASCYYFRQTCFVVIAE